MIILILWLENNIANHNNEKCLFITYSVLVIYSIEQGGDQLNAVMHVWSFMSFGLVISRLCECLLYDDVLGV